MMNMDNLNQHQPKDNNPVSQSTFSNIGDLDGMVLRKIQSAIVTLAQQDIMTCRDAEKVFQLAQVYRETYLLLSGQFGTRGE